MLAGSDADILVLKKNDLSIFCLLARGELMVQDEKVLKKAGSNHRPKAGRMEAGMGDKQKGV